MTAIPKLAIAALLVALAPRAGALELFGVELETSARDQLRDAARNAGLVLIREGGEDNWFDLYDSSAVLAGSVRFYLGFVKQDQRFAFAEYEFIGLQQKRLLQNLTRKYGPPEVEGGRFVSDRRYRWRRDGIDIELGSDWHNYRTRLIYTEPRNMAALLAERSGRKVAADGSAAISLY